MPHRLQYMLDPENRMRLFILLFCLVILITACSPEQNKTPKIAESQRETLDKAKAVDATVQEATAAEKQKIDEQAE